MRSKRFTLVALFLITALSLAGLTYLMMAPEGDVQAQSVLTYAFYAPTAGITQTAQTDSRWVYGLDQMDVFMMADVDDASSVTATVQTSYDGSSWADLLDAEGSAVTLTASTDSTVYTSLADVPGLYMRLSLAVTGTVTPTIKGVGR